MSIYIRIVETNIDFAAENTPYTIIVPCLHILFKNREKISENVTF